MNEKQLDFQIRRNWLRRCSEWYCSSSTAFDGRRVITRSTKDYDRWFNAAIIYYSARIYCLLLPICMLHDTSNSCRQQRNPPMMSRRSLGVTSTLNKHEWFFTLGVRPLIRKVIQKIISK